MTPQITNQQRTSAASSYVSTQVAENKTKPVIDMADFENSSQALVDSLGYDAYTFIIDGKERESAEFFVPYILSEANKFSSSDEKIEFLLKVMTKLNSLSTEIENAKTAVNQENFKSWTEIVEAHLIVEVNELPKTTSPSSKPVERTVAQKIENLFVTFNGTDGRLDTIMSADKTRYVRIGDTGYAPGNCGLNACEVAIGQSISRDVLVACQKAYISFIDPASTPETKAKDLSTIYNGNLEHCKKDLTKLLEENIINEGTNPSAQQRLRADQADIREVTSFEGLATNSHLVRHVSLPIEDFSENAHIDKTELSRGDVFILMKHLGFDCIDTGAPKNNKPAEKGTQTVMEFEHFATGHRVYIANDLRPGPQDQNEKTNLGRHWTAVIKAETLMSAPPKPLLADA